MLEIGLEALTTLLRPETLPYLLGGVALGIVVGILPGMGGLVGMSVLLPFIFGMEPVAGLALLVGLVAITQTADTFTSVLLGVPGSAGSQATIMDGYPLSLQGRAAEALGAGFLASLLGGIVAALTLYVGIFAARPVILSFQSPHLFMLVLLGLSMVGILSKGAARAGLLTGVFGLFLGAVGGAPTTAVYRFTFDTTYLWGGIPVAVLAIGLFAIPEILDLLIQNRAVSGSGKLTGKLTTGMKSTLRHWSLVLRSGGMGALLGMLPGIGGHVIDWLAYGVAAQTSRDSEGFGKGDIRGVIATESANNAKEGGVLVPALLLGIPGSPSSAIMLAGLVILGLEAGPRMVTDEMPLMLSIVWMLALANVIGTIVCLALSKPVAKISTINASIMAPFLIVILSAAAYQSSRHWGDLVVLTVVGIIGWIMKQVGWPRPPLLIGFVLSIPAERYLWTSIGRYGADWLLFPGVIGIALVILGVLAFSNVMKSKVENTSAESQEQARNV